jgi:pseudaminic acid biosynthesis-associated methylase
MKEKVQLAAWRGAFGDDYIGRNLPTDAVVAALVMAWARILAPLQGRMPQSVLEVGANVGRNLRALARLGIGELWGLEPNDKARERLVADGVVAPERALAGSAAAIAAPDRSIDLVFTSGVLIHVPPDMLGASCREMHRVARRYIACIEYFADQPAAVPYRGRSDLLFKRDFGAFWMETAPDLAIVDYGFFWRTATGLDNLTWWLFEKRGG